MIASQMDALSVVEQLLLIYKSITHHPVQNPTVSIDNTIIQIKHNGQEFRLGVMYKSPSKSLLGFDMDFLLKFPNDVILVGDLNEKIIFGITL